MIAMLEAASLIVVAVAVVFFIIEFLAEGKNE